MGRSIASTPRRTQPHSTEAEMAILGGIIIRNAVLQRLPEIETDHFYDPRNKVVWAAMRSLERKAMPIDIVTLEAEINAGGRLEAIGGVAYLGDCAAMVPTPDSVVEYARIVRDTWRWRDLMHDCARLIEAGYAEDVLNLDPIGEAAELMARALRAKPTSLTTLGQAVEAEMRRANDLVERRAAGEAVFSGLPLGLHDVDETIGGAPFGSYTLLLGLRGGAKTSSTQCMAQRAAATMARASKGVVVYAYNEDTPAFFAQRAIAGAARGALPTESIGRLTFAPDRGAFSPRGLQMFNAIGARVAKSDEAKLILLPIAGMDGVAVGRLLVQIHAEMGLAAAVIDYLQRMKGPKGIHGKPEQIAVNSQELGNAAFETGCALIVNAQLDPGIENRDWKEGGPIPKLGDTRWSKDPEADARLILALYDRWSHGKRLADDVRGDSEPGRNHLEPLREDVVELHCLKRTMGSPHVWWKLKWLRDSHWIGDLDDRDNGSKQLDLGARRTFNPSDDEAWRERMARAGSGDFHP